MRLAIKGGYRRGQREINTYSPAKSFESSIPTLATIVNPSISNKNANGLSTVALLKVFTATANKYTPKPPAKPTDNPTKKALTIRAPSLFLTVGALILQTNTFV